MNDETFTVLTFASVQGFIEKSRKLRDLFGSSFILSYLAATLCEAIDAHPNCRVLSPATINVVQGTPNQIVIAGCLSQADFNRHFYRAWGAIVEGCRLWIERELPDETYHWTDDWNRWRNHAWELFWGEGNSISEARQDLNQKKLERAWTGINWQGESSTLSGSDAVAWPGMGTPRDPKTHSLSDDDKRIRKFYTQLCQILGEPFASDNEQLSIPELIKRLVTYSSVARAIDRRNASNPDTATLRPLEPPRPYSDIERDRWTAWFQGDGDRIGEYLQQLKNRTGSEDEALQSFSKSMLDWGKTHLKPSVEGQADSDPKLGRLIYAGGDDFLGVLYENSGETAALNYLDWFVRLPALWQQHGHALTVSVGWVWASPQVPQRDVLQHCREAEKSAKTSGRDRLAIRIVFAGGNHLEWTCPWRFLPLLQNGYRDRDGKTGPTANWTHLYNDIAALESRHAFADRQTDVARALLHLYFPAHSATFAPENRWNHTEAGILGDPVAALIRIKQREPSDRQCSATDAELAKLSQTAYASERFNQWAIGLARIGFHLHQRRSSSASKESLTAAA